MYFELTAQVIYTLSQKQSKGLSVSGKVGLAVGIFLGALLLIGVAIVLHRWSKKPQTNSNDNQDNLQYSAHTNSCFQMERMSLTDLTCSNEEKDWEIDAVHVMFLEEIGKGAFGKVFKVIVRQPEPVTEQDIVLSRLRGNSRDRKLSKNNLIAAAKTLHEIANDDQRQEFIAEINLMKKLGSHQNIVNFLYCCTTSEPNFLIVEYLPKGDLLKYLRTYRYKVRRTTRESQ
ncbi:putative tyrosine-protein kinase F09A5.2 [Exaiptasia diaphana]|uniref:Protein kinase domain-containing protein n=1 Tax=Exaiptasia diaphana TaxID=2652724 RepID=A0A913XJ87_EXADI|nr:putative tyrosine-protein kinase F09A5.2 [Exaiptasia diaphana]